MKRFLAVVIFVVCGLCGASAQVVVNGLDINTKADLQYVELVGVAKGLFSRKVVVIVDHGQRFKFGKPQTITGPNGKNMKFFGMTAALNFMVKNGWEYVNSYLVTVGNSNVYHYLLKRKEISK